MTKENRIFQNIKKVKRGIFWIKRSKAGGKNKRARWRLTDDQFFLALVFFSMMLSVPFFTNNFLSTWGLTILRIPYRTKFSAPTSNIGSFVRQKVFHRFHISPYTLQERYVLTWVLYQFDIFWISADKIFRQQVRFPALFSAEILPDKVFLDFWGFSAYKLLQN